MCMYVKQLSIFMENRRGRIDEMLTILGDNQINIASVSLADTSEYGVFRMLVDDPERARSILREHHITAALNDVIAVSIPHEPGSLRKVICALHEAGIDISYIYGLSLSDGGASIVIKADDLAGAEKTLTDLGVKMYDQESLSSML